jgi:hypothetical protein
LTHARRATELSTLRGLSGGVLLAIALSVAGAESAHAEPLTPLTPTELQYLEQVRTVLTVSHDTAAFRSDGELLVAGRFACRMGSAHGMVGQLSTLVTPAVTQLAFIYLCPN